MASSRPFEPCMHCRKDRPNDVSALSIRLLNGLYANPGKFPNPKVDKVFFENESKLLRKRLGYFKGDSNAIKLCKSSARTVHGLCKILLNYAKPICYENIDLIILSGFDSNRQPSKHQAPRQPKITKVIKTGGQFQYKIILAKIKIADKTNPKPDTHQRDVRYVAELTLTPDIESSWDKVCVNAASTKLIFQNVFPGQRNYVRVYGINVAGRGKVSANFYFTPELP